MGTKRLSAVAFTFCLVFLFMPNLSAKAEDNEVIRVGYYASYTDFIIDTDSLNNKGYGYEIFNKIEQISDLTFEYIPIEGDLIDAIENDIVDVAGFAIRTDTRREDVVFSVTPYSKTYAALMTDDHSITYNTPEVLDGKTVATYEDNYAQQFLDTYCEQQGISVKYVYGNIDNYTDVEADFYITYLEDPNVLNKNNVLNLGVFNLYMMTSPENQDILTSIDLMFRQIVNSEGNFFLELEEKYLSTNLEINHRSLTQNELDILNERTLEVGYITGYRPISYMDEDGNPAGAMLDTFQSLVDRFGFEVNYHPYSITDDPSSYSHYDILITLYGDRDTTDNTHSATENYYSVPMYAQVHLDTYKNSATFKELIQNAPRMGILKYQGIDYDALTSIYSDSEFVFYNDFNEMLDSFSRREIDMVIFTESASPYAELYLDDFDTVTVHTDILLPSQFYVSNELGDKYLTIFNVMLDRFSHSDYAEIIISNSNAYYPEDGILEILTDYWYYFALIILAVLTAFVILIYVARLRKKEALLQAFNKDSLTGFMSIQKFRESMDDLLEKSNPNEYELISFDVDMFKTINTHFSNERGTNVILAISDALKRTFKDSSAIICRRTADQFLIFRKVGIGGSMNQIYSMEILPSVKDVLNEKYSISMSFGNVLVSDSKEKSTSIIGKADTARTQGKSEHKTTFKTFDQKMEKYYQDRINITFRMEKSLKDREFSVVYQPKVDFKTLKVSGAEALVRWHPKLSETIFPDSFIPIFEANGFISNLDLYVLEEVCVFIKTNFKKMNMPRISVNLSSHTVLSDNLIPNIADIIDKHQIKPSEIEFELTESAVEGDTERFLQRVKQLKKLGFLISIDDFGAGVSSLNRLSAVEADVLKLDKAFFNLKDQGGKSNIVVSNIITMAKQMNMKVVAEGVETFAQALWLREIDCDYAQGYYFAKPLKEEDFKTLLISDKKYDIEFFSSTAI